MKNTIFLAIFLFAGCCSSIPPSPINTGFITKKNTAEVSQILSRRLAEVKTIEATVSFSYQSKERSGTCSAVFLAAPPKKLRIQGYAPLMPLLFDLLVSDGQVQLYNPGEKKLIISKDVLMGTDMIETMSLLNEKKVVEIYQDDRVMVLGVFENDKLRASLTVSGEELFIVQQCVFGPSRVENIVRYADYRKVQGVWWPHLMDIERFTGERIRVYFQEVSINTNLSDKAFRLVIPPGTKVEKQ